MNNDRQLLPLITPEMLRTMPDQTCDILNRLIRFYQDYQKESSVAIQKNSDSIDSLNSAITDIVIPTVGNGQLTIRQNGESIGTFTANQSGNTAVDIEVLTDFDQISGAINSSQIASGAVTSDNIDWATMVPEITETGNRDGVGDATYQRCYRFPNGFQLIEGVYNPAKNTASGTVSSYTVTFQKPFSELPTVVEGFMSTSSAYQVGAFTLGHGQVTKTTVQLYAWFASGQGSARQPIWSYFALGKYDAGD